jgi:hypothetical protein
LKHIIAIHAVPAALIAIMAFGSPTQAATIAINYEFDGVAEVVDGTATTLTLDALATGMITTNNAAQNAIWNPVSYSDESILDLNTGFLSGDFTMMFADGATLTGSVFEDDSAVLQSASQTGPFTQTLTITGGTNEFAGATGEVSGVGFIGPVGFSVQGNGTLNVATAPEPSSATLAFGALAILVAGGHRFAKRLRIRPGSIL